ncbi:MAG TPA: ribonuclease Y [Thermoleophilaceae bacterium]|jgi:ribonuclease Y|nr:ribonuclease Y [Thermoleophilaceae bacterium]
MEIVLAAVVAAAVAGIVVLAGQRRGPAAAAAGGQRVRSDASLVKASATAPTEAPAPVAVPSSSGSGQTPPALTAVSPAAAGVTPNDGELQVRRAELARIEERLLSKEEAVDLRLADLERKERSIEDRSRNIEHQGERLKEAKQDHIRELERLSGLSAGQARQLLLRELEDELRHDRAVLARQVEDEVRHDAERRSRSILATAMQRIASGHAAETTVSVVQLPSDELKGRIIGREGRNIRALETLTGVDFIIDDTPSAVLLSGFDPVRREIARLTLERLIQDGRIHPARIEEAYHQAQEEIDKHIAEVGEQAALEANAGQIHPELTKLLGRLHYRTSYGQNVLAHSIECANLAGMIAAELGASVKTARRAALLHDIGKAVTHEIEGPHALVGGQLARRYKESEAVAHAMEAHHGEVEMQTVEAVIVQVADALSGARPGARGESLEHYVKRLRELEEIARRHDGVDKVYAMQAGREIRVIVQPAQVDDERAALISHQIARDVEKELEYPGQIKVTVIRESRAVDFAK